LPYLFGDERFLDILLEKLGWNYLKLRSRPKRKKCLSLLLPVSAMGTVEIQKKGEIYGKITCRKLIVNKGGTFSGRVKMLSNNSNHSQGA
jgi:hypothetical protein